MSRAILLPITDDVLAFRFWMENFKTYAKYVDELLVFVNGPAANALQSDHPKITCLRQEAANWNHGDAMDWLVRETNADVFMFAEDDAFVREPAAIDRAFAAIERGDCDIVGCPQDPRGHDLFAIAEQRFLAPPLDDYCDQGTTLWPCFFFADRAHYMQYAIQYASRAVAYNEGVRVPVLDVPATANAFHDTLGLVSWALRVQGSRIQYARQFRHTVDMVRHARWLAEDPTWFHVGSLSAVLHLRRAHGYEHVRGIAGSAEDWAKRAAWWQCIAETAPACAERDQQRGLVASILSEPLIDPALFAAWVDHNKEWVNW